MLSDRIGRKKVIYGGLLLFAIGSFVAAGAHDIATLTVGRVIQAPAPSPPPSPRCWPTLPARRTAPRRWR